MQYGLQKIVDGAMGMVQMAIERLERENVVKLDEERKAARRAVKHYCYRHRAVER